MRWIQSFVDLLVSFKSRSHYRLARRGRRDLAIQQLETRWLLSANTPDTYESNDSLSTATFLGDPGRGTTLRPTLTIHSATDRDFYKITTVGMGAGSDSITVSFTHSFGNLDARLLDAQGNVLVSSTGVVNNENLSLQGLPAGTYFFEVYGFAGATNTYKLSFFAPSFQPPDQPDRFETNNSIAMATNLQTLAGLSSALDLSIHTSTDRDFYKFTTSSFGTSAHFVDVDFIHANGNIDARLLDANGTPLVISNGTTNKERLSLQGLDQGTYYLEVFANSGARNRYDISFTAPTFASADRFESNDTLLTSTNLQTISGTSEVSQLSIHSNTDRDFYKFITSGLGTSAHYVDVIFSHTDGDIDARLLNSNGVALATSSTVLNSERLSLKGLASGTYYIEIFGHQGARNNYRLSFSTPAPVLPDRYETNDNRQSATNLQTLSGAFSVSDLSIHSSGDRDFYRFATTSTGTNAHYVDVLFTHANGNLGARLLDATGATLITAVGSADNHRISLQGLSPGEYLLEVFGNVGSQNRYSINFDTPTPPTADRFESNETLDTATNLQTFSGSLALSDLSIHSSTDRDFFKFTTIGFGANSDYIDLHYQHSDGDIDFKLLDSLGTVITSSSGVSNTERISLEGRVAGTYFLEVFGYKGVRNRYRLSFQTPLPVTPDRFEANDTRQTATDLRTIPGSLKLSNLSLTPDNRDFYRFEILSIPTSSHSIQASFAHAGGDINLRLLDAQGTTVTTSTETTDHERISLSGLAAGVYYLEVFAASATVANNYSLDFATPSNQPSVADAWTLMVYITTDNLENPAFEDINEMERAVSRLPGTVNISVFWDQNSGRNKIFPTGGGRQRAWGTAGRAFIAGDNNMRSIATTFEILPETNTGNPQTLIDFVNWSMNNAPAQKYGLILWDHGSGLWGFNYDRERIGQTADNLTTQELVQALGTLRTNGKKIDLLSFDACLMGMTEVGHSIRELTNTFVSAQESVDGTGHDYSTLFKLLEADPYSVSSDTLATGFVRSFSDQYLGRSSGDTQSAISTLGYANVIAALSSFTSAATTATITDKTAIASARNATPFYTSEDLRDLGGFMRRIAANSSISESIRTAASGVVNAVSQAVISKSADRRNSSGMSIYLPILGSQVSSFYKTQYSAFDSATRWSQFLEAPTDKGRNLRGDWAGSTNSLAARAFDLGTILGEGTTFDFLTLESSTDVDWFRFSLDGSTDSLHRVVAQANGVASQIDLRLYDVTGTTLLREVTNGSSGLSLSGLLAGQYSLRVAADNAVDRYSLKFDAPIGQTDTIIRNTTPEKAIQWGVVSSDHLFTGLVAGNTISNEQWSYFRFSTAPLVVQQNFSLQLNSATNIPLDFEILDESLVPIGSTSGDGSATLLMSPKGSGESYFVRVRQSPERSSLAITSIGVRIEDLNIYNPAQAPTDIVLNSSFVLENEEAGTVVGTLAATDPNPGDTFTFSLVPGLGSTDNSSFIINGSSISTTNRFDFETKSIYSIRVGVIDSFGLIFEKPFTITVGDVDEPNAQNPTNRFDVNNDGFISPLDVLLIINLLNQFGSSIPIGQLSQIPPYVNVDGDSTVSPLDVLQLINFINTRDMGEGESSSQHMIQISIANDIQSPTIGSGGIAFETDRSKTHLQAKEPKYRELDHSHAKSPQKTLNVPTEPDFLESDPSDLLVPKLIDTDHVFASLDDSDFKSNLKPAF